MEHTKGPWNYAKDDWGSKISIYHNGPLAYVGDTGYGMENAEANARLIAAAPDMLQVLKDVWECGDSIRHNSIIWKDIQTVIKQAEGGE